MVKPVVKMVESGEKLQNLLGMTIWGGVPRKSRIEYSHDPVLGYFSEA